VIFDLEHAFEHNLDADPLWWVWEISWQ